MEGSEVATTAHQFLLAEAMREGTLVAAIAAALPLAEATKVEMVS